MRLDRNTVEGGEGKYALVKMRRVRELSHATGDPDRLDRMLAALQTLRDLDVLDESPAESEGEFFVIRLRDIHAGVALAAYSAK